MSDLSKWKEETLFNCKQISNKTNIITNAYNGIPETFILNIISWILLLLVFSLLRHQAVDFHRLALIIHDGKKKRWTEVFYARCPKITNSTYPPKAFNVDQTCRTAFPNSQYSNNLNARESVQSTELNYEDGIFTWIKATWKLRKEEILLHTGPDAVHYLSFQLHLMIVMTVVTLISIFIILPVNFFNGPINDEFNVNSFGRTTMANLNSNSTWLWVHVVVSIMYAPLIVLIMRRASGRNAFKKAPTRTIMISDIGLNDRNKTVIRNYMQELFPEVSIEDVQIAYNISKLHARYVKYEKMHQARLFCEKQRNRDSLEVKNGICFCGKTNAFEFYQHEERILAGDVARLRAASLNEPLGIAFITVSTVLEAQNIIKYFHSIAQKPWILTFAPSPVDIFWENLNVSKSHWYITWIAVNFLLFVFLFFLTTPIMVVNFLNIYALEKYSIGMFSPLISEFLPTLLLWTLSSLMPVIVAFSDKWLSHYTRSLQNYSIMTKCFGYLLFMIFILPSLGFSSAQAFLDWSISNDTMRWQCFFLPDRGSFYVNYVITAAFIGTSLELLRFPELCVYIWMLFKARSEAETPFIRKSILIEFPFGVHYAWTVLIFTISIVYSVFCPLIMPFAMIYICLKHFVDRHNLYFVYGPSNMISRNGGKIHSTAVTMTKFAVILLLTIMSMISYVRGLGIVRAIVTLFALVAVVTLFTLMSPIKRCTSVRRPSIIDIAGPTPTYIADVLQVDQITPSTELPVIPVAFNLDHSYEEDSASNFDPNSDYCVNSIGAD